MKIIKVEKKENESLAWEIVALLCALLNFILFGAISYLAITKPEPKTIGLLSALNLTVLAILFIALKKGVVMPERVHVKI